MLPCKVRGYVKKVHSAVLRMRILLFRREKFFQNGFERRGAKTQPTCLHQYASAASC